MYKIEIDSPWSRLDRDTSGQCFAYLGTRRGQRRLASALSEEPYLFRYLMIGGSSFPMIHVKSQSRYNHQTTARGSFETRFQNRTNHKLYNAKVDHPLRRYVTPNQYSFPWIPSPPVEQQFRSQARPFSSFPTSAHQSQSIC